MIAWSELFPEGTRVAALPTWRHVRLFVADDPRDRSLSALYPASRPTARAARLVARALHDLGLLPRRVARGGVLADGLRRFGRVAAVLPGTPGPTRKTTLALANDRGLVAFAKLAGLGAARARLRNEHAMLGALGDRGFATVPRVLGFDDRPDRTLLVVGALPGQPLPWGPPPAAIRAVIDRLHGGPKAMASDHAWLVELAAEGSRAWLDALGRRPWPRAIRHGDLTGGHVLVDDGRMALIDWEYGALDGFPWIDLAHYALQADALVRRARPHAARARARQRLAAKPWPGLAEAEADAIVRIAAFAAHRDARIDGHADDAPLQLWRRAVWQD